ncbi:hypothetical protein AUP41_06645 [Thalassospira xiamenensis]|nr:hypothetical protein AUP41_06645 [Thalassospira xiamenensis]
MADDGSHAEIPVHFHGVRDAPFFAGKGEKQVTDFVLFGVAEHRNDFFVADDGAVCNVGAKSVSGRWAQYRTAS